MKTARLIRIEQGSAGTFGLFVTDGGWWYSMELPWKDNERGVSCIPEGEYECHWTYSETLERGTYILGHVNDRDGIRIHAANRVTELKGCIALGNTLTEIGGENCLQSSKRAIEAMRACMCGQPFKLIIQRGL